MQRMEHPKPQFERASWQNLNGEWEFTFDKSDSGEARGLFGMDTPYDKKIILPFCPESKLSGIGFVDFMAAVWYRRKFTLTQEQVQNRVVLHFGAVDYTATVEVNGKRVGMHEGGYSSFCFDITAFVQAGENTIIVRAQDDTRPWLRPTGKQSKEYASFGCFYTRTTGIWQTVWLEFTPKAYIESVKYYPDANSGTITFLAKVCGKGDLKVEASYQGKPMGEAVTRVNGGVATLTITLKEKHLWEVGNGRLYDLKWTFNQDEVKSYFGLRSVALDGYKFLLNGKSVFQRLILDQGFYPDGIYTAPSDAELEADIDRSLAMGFNGARLHEKIFEERFLYHCDKKGYIVWGEFPDWGADWMKGIQGGCREWIEEIERDFNHPAIVGWCPLNERWEKEANEYCKTPYAITKAIDPTRPCIDASGGIHVQTDIYDIHDYEQNPEIFAKSYAPEKVLDGSFFDWIKDKHTPSKSVYKIGQPFFVSEYGGIRWTENQDGWGYGDAPKTEAEFLARLKGLTDAILDNPYICALCYTQLTDVEQEQNGLYTYDRKPKFACEKIYPIFSRKAAIEEE